MNISIQWVCIYLYNGCVSIYTIRCVSIYTIGCINEYIYLYNRIFFV